MLAELNEWLSYISHTSHQSINLGLDRVRTVWQSLSSNIPKLPTVITVAGTNGKGSCVALLEQIFIAQAIKIGSFTSPHIVVFNERIKINGVMVTNKILVQAFQQVENARLKSPSVQLTFFEYNTLVALYIFALEECQVLVLEIGMGGRLDAVNLIDPDISIITSIAHDHADFLGSNLAQIATEKAGVMRSGKFTVCAEDTMPVTVQEYADLINANLVWLNKDYAYQKEKNHWSFISYSKQLAQQLTELPLPNLIGRAGMQNVAAVVQTIQLYNQLAISQQVSVESIAKGISTTKVMARYQEVSYDEKIDLVFDVAHNPVAMLNLVTSFQHRRKPVAIIFSALQDKEAVNLLNCWGDDCIKWFTFELNNERARKLVDLQQDFLDAEISAVGLHQNLSFLWDDVVEYLNKRITTQKEMVLITGSFFTVAEVAGFLDINLHNSN